MSLLQLFSKQKESLEDNLNQDGIIAELEAAKEALLKENDELREQEEKLQQIVKENQGAVKVKLDSMTNLTMDARRLINSIHGTIGNLRTSAGQKEQKIMDVLETNADQMLFIIYQFMDILEVDHAVIDKEIKSDGSQKKAETAMKRSSGEKPVLLLVDDNEDMRAYIRKLLQDDFRILEASDGVNGYTMAVNNVPDFIVSDLVMPVCDGMEYCTRIRSNKNLSHIPFLILTGHEEDDTRFKSYKSGVDGYLTKPFEPQLLKARIENILENRMHLQSQMMTNLDNAYAVVDIEEPDKLFMEKISMIMRENYSDPNFNVAELTSKAGMSNTSFYKKITSLTGLTTSHYIRLYRLQTAKHIIEEHKATKGISIADIAYRVGFNDPKYFTRCFVAQFGIQPKAMLDGKEAAD